MPQAVFLLLMLGGSVWLAWRRPQLGFCALFFFLVLAPTSSVVPMVDEVGADRRVYLPLCGLCALVALADRWRKWVLVAARVLAIIAIGRNEVYRDPIALWRADVAALPGNYRAHNNLGLALIGAGQMREAVPHFQRALKIEPGFAEAHNNLGLALARLGHAEASEHYRRALAANPAYASAHNNLGLILGALGRTREALAAFRKAIELDRLGPPSYLNLARELVRARDVAAAKEVLEDLLEIAPDHPRALALLRSLGSE